MRYILSAYLVLFLSFFISSQVDTAIDPYQKENEIITQAFRLDNIIQTEYNIEMLPFNARKLDSIINDEMQMTYTDDKIKEMSYDTLLAVDNKFVMKKLKFTSTKKQYKQELLKITKAVAREQNISPTLFAALIKTESNLESQAISPAGAIGLSQIIPANFRKLEIEDPFNILQNLRGGAKYLKEMLDTFDGSITLALAAYNAGPGAVQRYKNNIPPYQETVEYVEKVIDRFKEYKKKGLSYAYKPTKSG